MASTATAQVAADEGEIAGLDGDVGPGAHGDAEVGLGEGGGVVDSVADHRHHPSLLSADDGPRRPCPRGGPRRSRRRRAMPTAAATDSAARRLSPVTSIGRSPRSRSWLTASALVGFTVSATTSTPRSSPSQPTRTGVLPGSPRRRRGREQLAVEVRCRDRRGSCAGRRRSTWPSTMPVTPRPRVLRNPVDGGEVVAGGHGAGGDRRGDRVLARRAPATRRGGARRPRRCRRRRGLRRGSSHPSSPCRSCRARSCRPCASTRVPRVP